MFSLLLGITNYECAVQMYQLGLAKSVVRFTCFGVWTKIQKT